MIQPTNIPYVSSREELIDGSKNDYRHLNVKQNLFLGITASSSPPRLLVFCQRIFIVLIFLMFFGTLDAQVNFSLSNLDFNGMASVDAATSLMFGPDGRLYVLNLKGPIDVLTITQNGPGDYVVTAAEELLLVQSIPNHNDDGSSHAGTDREATGLTLAGTATNPVIYVTSSDSRVGGPGGDVDLDTNSGVITRITWNGMAWVAVDIVRGLPRSEENHATNGLEFVTIGGTDYLLVCQGGHTNAGGPCDNFAWTTEYALSAAVLSVNLDMIEAMPILNDGRDYIYDIPTLDDPTRVNVNGIDDPDDPQYNGIDQNDPWGGNDGLNQAMVVANGPVQIFSPGYRNTYDLCVTESGAVYVTDNGANVNWGGMPTNEGGPVMGISNVTNDYYLVGGQELGSNIADVDGELVNNKDHLSLVTLDIQNYTFGSFYGGHPTPVRANPTGAGLYTNPTANGTTDAVFRTLTYDPVNPGPESTDDPSIALPANWPPVPPGMANPVEGDWRAPGGTNPDGPNDILVTTWSNNANGIDEYTFDHPDDPTLKGSLIAGKEGSLYRVQVDANGELVDLNQSFATGLDGNSLGVTCNGSSDPFPGTIWVATFNNVIKVLDPGTINCLAVDDPEYDANADYDNDGYTNQDEVDNGTDHCAGSSQPDDHDKAAGGTLVSDLNDPDDDNDGVLDQDDVLQIGNPLTGGNDAFDIPVILDLELTQSSTLGGFLGLGLTGLMNNGDPNPNWRNWLNEYDANGLDVNGTPDLYGGAIGLVTMYVTDGTADGIANNQEKGFQFGANVSSSDNPFTIECLMKGFNGNLQLYDNAINAPDAELGIQIGNGTQDDFIKFVINRTGLALVEEVANSTDETQSLALSAGERPQGTAGNIIFYLDVIPSSGQITARYRIDGGTIETLGSVTAQGLTLQAIQSSDPLIIGMYGSSHAASLEIEGSWDYFYVQFSQPTIQQDLPDLTRLISDPDDVFDLNEYFQDDLGDGNLTYTIENNTDPNVDASITGDLLTLSYSVAANADITIRATDQGALFTEQTFNVEVIEQAAVLFRINAGGPLISATDAPNPDWLANSGEGAQNGTQNGIAFSVNTGSSSTLNVPNRHSSVPSYAPQSLFAQERYDPSGAPEMLWSFNTGNGDFTVNLFMANGFSGTSEPGQRIFDVEIEGVEVITDKDLSNEYGHWVGAMESFNVTVTDGSLEIEFLHQVDNPLINAIEILGSPITPPISVDAIANQTNEIDDNVYLEVIASGGDPMENFTYSATNLPTGISIEPTTGVIDGMIDPGAAANSPWNVTVTVGKPSSTPVDVNFQWIITAPPPDQWTDQTDDENYTARHECSFVQAGKHFWLLGGRENATTLDKYDFATKQWTSISNSAPSEFNHFQAVEYKGLIWVIGAFETNTFPNETPATNIWTYNPASDVWIEGPEIPAARRRGSTGLVVHNDKFYVVAGNTMGHDGGFVDWFDSFDPTTGQWQQLPDAPHARDHFHATVLDDKLYVVGGRLSGGTGGTFAPLVPEVDVYDFTNGTWSTLPIGKNLPTPRAAAAVATFENEIYVIGGEIESSNDALSVTEAYDPVNDTWSTKANLITQRHGTQAIVSGSGIHMAAGSSTQGGGGPLKNMEYYGNDNPSGIDLIASQLSVPSSLTIAPGSSADLSLKNVDGNVGVIVTDLAISGAQASLFNIEAPSSSFFLLCPDEIKVVSIKHLGTQAGDEAQLTITYDGGQTKVVPIASGTPVATVLYRVNAGGPLTAAGDGGMDWSADEGQFGEEGNSMYLSKISSGTSIFSQAVEGAYQGPVDMSDPSLPAGTPSTLFTIERFDNDPQLPDMEWEFPITVGENIEVRIYLAELFSEIDMVGERIFDVAVEGVVPPVFENLDAFASHGALGAFMLSHIVTATDNTLDLDFTHLGMQNPAIKGIEILSYGAGVKPGNCFSDLVLDTSPSNGTFLAGNSIIANAITVTTQAEYSAPSVQLNAGFSVAENAQFIISLDGCNQSN